MTVIELGMAVIDEVAKHHIIQAGFQVLHLQISVNGGLSPQRSETIVGTIGHRGKGIVLPLVSRKLYRVSRTRSSEVSSKAKTQYQVLLLPGQPQQ